MLTSIQSKLIVWFLTVFSIVLIGLGFFLDYQLSEIVIGSVDSHLNSEVQFIAGLLRVEQQQGPLETELLEFSQAAVGEYSVALSGHYYQIVSSNGKLLVRSPSLAIPNASLPIEAESLTPSYKTIVGPEKTPLRLLNQSFQLPTGVLTLQTAESLEESYKLLGSFRKIILIVFPVLFIVSGIGIWMMIDLSLRPLELFSKQIGQITEKNLNERMDERSAARELRPLAVSFNTMLGRLEAAFSKQGQFLSDASHELRTPTSVIKSYCDVTLGKERTPSEYQEALRMIATNVDRMTDIINRILEISRFDSKTFSWVTVEVDLLDVMNDACKLLEASASSRKIALRLNGVKTTVRADRERLTEALLNIVDNAIKYNRTGGRVEIDVTRAGPWAVVTVTDTGIGIPDIDRQSIFDRFHRLADGRDLAAGSGLGLSITRAIVEAHGGKIDVQSEVGKGSQFRIFLPAVAP
ncbi:MAG: HAMP domain-containing protein [Nitrospirae bacterium]|nr:HAMP domain-containing protein [Nitrospirota bacterium]